MNYPNQRRNDEEIQVINPQDLKRCSMKAQVCVQRKNIVITEKKVLKLIQRIKHQVTAI